MPDGSSSRSHKRVSVGELIYQQATWYVNVAHPCIPVRSLKNLTGGALIAAALLNDEVVEPRGTKKIKHSSKRKKLAVDELKDEERKKADERVKLSEYIYDSCKAYNLTPTEEEYEDLVQFFSEIDDYKNASPVFCYLEGFRRGFSKGLGKKEIEATSKVVESLKVIIAELKSSAGDRYFEISQQLQRIVMSIENIRNGSRKVISGSLGEYLDILELNRVFLKAYGGQQNGEALFLDICKTYSNEEWKRFKDFPKDAVKEKKIILSKVREHHEKLKEIADEEKEK